MKRLSTKAKTRQVLSAKNGPLRQKKRNDAKPYTDPNFGSRRRVATRRGSSRIIDLVLPDHLSFNENPRATLDFFQEFRRVAFNRRKSFRINFTGLKRIGPAAAIVLTAEINRWMILRDKKVRVLDVDKWDDAIIHLLYDMGMFSLLNVVNLAEVLGRITTQPFIKFIKFKTGIAVVGDLAKELRQSLEEVVGEGRINRPALFSGLSEAMTNVTHHAYPRRTQHRRRMIRRSWWMTGSYEETTGMLSVVFFDQGIGIPASLDRKSKREQIMKLLSDTTSPIFSMFGSTTLANVMNDDAQRIKLAFALGRTRTQETNRGKGLNNLLELVGSRSGNYLRVLSGKGSYTYIAGDGTEPDDEQFVTLPTDIGGTLIEWHVRI